MAGPQQPDDDLEVTLRWPGGAATGDAGVADGPEAAPTGQPVSAPRETGGARGPVRLRSVGGAMAGLRAEVDDLRARVADLTAEVQALRARLDDDG